MSTVVASIFLLILCMVHIYMDLKLLPAILAATSSVLMLMLYYFVRFRSCLIIPKIILTIGGLIMLDFTWYSKYLSYGPILFFILIFAALVIWVWSGKQLVILMAVYFINLAVLFYIDYNSTENLFKYSDHYTRSIDIFLSFFFYSILLISLLYIVKREFLRQKEKVNEVNELYFGLFSNTTTGLYQVSPSGQVFSANPALLKMLFFDSLSDLLLWNFSSGRYVDPVKRSEFRKIIEEKEEITDHESEWYTKNGDIIVVLESVKAVKNKSGEIIRYDGTVENITEITKIQKELIKAVEKAKESDRLKSAFLANMSHEIRTPMNGIIGFMDLLKQPLLDIESQQQYIGIVENSGNRLLNIINDIISISKIESGMVDVFVSDSDINKQIEYIYKFFQPEIQAKGLSFQYYNSLPSSQAVIRTDREKLFAILTNLVKNAIKFTNKGSIEIGYYKKNNFLEFYVRDTGIGIGQERQKAVFERFVQADIEDKNAYEGAGLGLSIAKAYTELLGGELRVESKKDSGSTFFFTIPYILEQGEISQINTYQASSDLIKQLKRIKILIVEDDQTSNLLLNTFLKELDAEILNAGNGSNAIDICRSNTDLDLILMDIKLPGMDGYETTRQIRKFNKSVIIIAQTAYGLVGDDEKAIKSGCNAYLKKPILKNDLFLLINQYLGQVNQA